MRWGRPNSLNVRSKTVKAKVSWVVDSASQVSRYRLPQNTRCRGRDEHALPTQQSRLVVELGARGAGPTAAPTFHEVTAIEDRVDGADGRQVRAGELLAELLANL